MQLTLRTRLGRGTLIAFLVGVICHGLGTYLAYDQTMNVSNGMLQSQVVLPRYTLLAVFSSVGSFAIAIGVAMAAGMVASFVIEEALERRLEMEADLFEDEAPGELLSDSD